MHSDKAYGRQPLRVRQAHVEEAVEQKFSGGESTTPAANQ